MSDDLNSIIKTGDLSGVQDALNRGVGRLNEAEAEIARQLEDIDNQLDVIAADLAAAMGTAEDVADFLAGPPSGWMSGWRSSSSGWRSCGTMPTTIPPSRSGWATPFTTSGSFGTC